MVAFLNQVFSCLSLYLAQREDRPLSVNTHTTKAFWLWTFLFVVESEATDSFTVRAQTVGAAALEVPAAVNVNFKPVLNMTHLRFLRQEIISHWRRCTEEFSLSPLFVSPLSSFSSPLSTFLLLLSVCALRVLLEGVQKDTVWNEHSSDLPDTPDTANQITSPWHIGHYNWSVGGKYDQWGFKWREKKRREWGGVREWCYGSSKHFNRPFAQDRTGNLQNKS